MNLIKSILMRIRKPHAYNPNTHKKILRPDIQSQTSYDLDIRNPDSSVWYRYLGANSPDHLNEHIAATIAQNGLYRVVEVRTGKIVQTNE